MLSSFLGCSLSSKLQCVSLKCYYKVRHGYNLTVHWELLNEACTLAPRLKHWSLIQCFPHSLRKHHHNRVVHQHTVPPPLPKIRTHLWSHKKQWVQVLATETSFSILGLKTSSIYIFLHVCLCAKKLLNSPPLSIPIHIHCFSQPLLLSVHVHQCVVYVYVGKLCVYGGQGWPVFLLSRSSFETRSGRESGSPRLSGQWFRVSTCVPTPTEFSAGVRGAQQCAHLLGGSCCAWYFMLSPVPSPCCHLYRTSLVTGKTLPFL